MCFKTVLMSVGALFLLSPVFVWQTYVSAMLICIGGFMVLMKGHVSQKRTRDRDGEERRGEGCIDWIVHSTIHESNQLFLLGLPCVLLSVLTPIYSSFLCLSLCVPLQGFFFACLSFVFSLFGLVSLIHIILSNHVWLCDFFIICCLAHTASF